MVALKDDVSYIKERSDRVSTSAMQSNYSIHVDTDLMEDPAISDPAIQFISPGL
jgi:hypothetical protein